MSPFPTKRPSGSGTSAHLELLLFRLLITLTIAIYWPGLGGGFLFDDQVHIVKNEQVHIHDLSPASLSQAWHSSLAPFPASRPLAMLSFGATHALAGLSPQAFKGVNLAIHLLDGWLLWLLTRRLAKIYLMGRGQDDAAVETWALLVSGLWLLHPLNLSPVLYAVQRMNGLSTLFVLVALLLYTAGRERMATGAAGGRWLLLLGPLAAGTGFLAKENAALFPLYALVLELTLLARLPRNLKDRRFLLGYFFLLLGLPLLLVAWRYLRHPGWILSGFESRPFDLQERLLTEARALWFYLRLLLVPDLSQLGLFHDDFWISRGLLSPWTTLVAVVGWIAVLPLALIWRRRLPVLCFAILFFLAGHSLESSFIPLELVFEHRNYLPAFGPLFALGYLFNLAARETRLRRWVGTAALVLLGLLAGTTLQRAIDWGEPVRFALSEVEHHPGSPRANLRAARLLISNLPNTGRPQVYYQAARHYLERVRQLAPDNLDGLFGLIVLNLHAQKPAERRWVEDLKQGLRHGRVSPTVLTTSQFSFLVRWELSGGYPLPRETLLEIFEAALANPRFDRYGRAGIQSALRAYYDQVLGEPEPALVYARKAVATWPERWHYQDRLVRLLVKLRRFDEAAEALDKARDSDSAKLHAEEANELEKILARMRVLVAEEKVDT